MPAADIKSFPILPFSHGILKASGLEKPLMQKCLDNFMVGSAVTVLGTAAAKLKILR